MALYVLSTIHVHGPLLNYKENFVFTSIVINISHLLTYFGTLLRHSVVW
jgi:hypothetical protein